MLVKSFEIEWLLFLAYGFGRFVLKCKDLF